MHIESVVNPRYHKLKNIESAVNPVTISISNKVKIIKNLASCISKSWEA
jgi:hypothetical protein